MAQSSTQEEENIQHLISNTQKQELELICNAEQKQEFEPVFREKDEVIELGTYLYLNRFNEVSLASQTFRAAFNVEFQWKATSEEHKNYLNDEESYIPSWTPNFANSILQKPRETNAVYNVCHYYSQYYV